VLVAPRVSTLWKDRAAHAPATARLLSDAIAAVPGNVALYFSSFAVLDDLVARLDLGGRELLAQRPGLSEADRTAWLTRLAAGGTPVVLAAVLGGIFAEGIDLPAGALAAVVVVGPALPPVGLERDLLREHYETRFGQGFRYASQVPGMTRVVQAAGRLIRRPDDRGTILLVCRRFRWPDFASLLPADWSPVLSDDPAADIAGFWGVAR
jgi:Rad3-related DNA helicase